MSLSGNWNYPTAVKFGAGRIKELPEVCRAAGIRRPLLVTDSGLARLPMVAEAVAANAAAGLATAVFCEVKPNPVERNVADGIRAYRDGEHDGVIAFGGGSALDAGKAIAFLSGQSRPMWDFEDVADNWTRADPAGIAPTVAVPTTAGTGSEVGRVAVVTDEGTHTKRLIFHPRIMPVAVIGDPELTIGVPPAITAWTGFDALAHCLEAYCAPGFHPMADGIALEGMRLIKSALPLAYRDGRNIEARVQMMAAATMGAVAFQKGLGAIHSLAHPIGAHFDAHHGLLNAILMPYVLAHNAPAIDGRMGHLAVVLGLQRKDTNGVIDWVLALREDLQIPSTLAGIVDERFADEAARAGAVDPTAPTNPVPLDAGALRAIFLKAVTG